MRFVLCLSTSLLASAAASSEEPPPPPAAGPISVKMSIAEAKRAAPSVQWKDEVSRHSGKTLSITGDNAWTLEGHAYQIKFRPLSYGASILTLRGEHEVDSLETCRARVVAFATHFDRYFEGLEPRWSIEDQMATQPSSATITAQRSPEGHLFVTAQPYIAPAAAEESDRKRTVLSVGRNARLREVLVADGSALWDFIKHASRTYDYSIGADGWFHKNESAGKSTCSIKAELRSQPKDRPAFELLDTVKVKPIALPSAATRHYSLDGFDLPAEGVTLQFRCDIGRETGQLQGCALPTAAEENTREARAARTRLREYRYDPKQLDPDNDLRLQTNVTIKLSRADRDPALAAAAPALPVWAQTASPSELSRHYPARALANGIKAKVVATCRIEPDLSLACLSFETDPPGLTMFEDATKRILSKYRASPRLKNDAPAAGSIVKVPLRFEFEE